MVVTDLNLITALEALPLVWETPAGTNIEMARVNYGGKSYSRTRGGNYPNVWEENVPIGLDPGEWGGLPIKPSPLPVVPTVPPAAHGDEWIEGVPNLYLGIGVAAAVLLIIASDRKK